MFQAIDGETAPYVRQVEIVHLNAGGEREGLSSASYSSMRYSISGRSTRKQRQADDKR